MTTFADRLTAAAAAYTTARDDYWAWRDAAIAAEYARRRTEDRAAGRDTSGKSVQLRQLRSYDTVIMSDEARARRDAVDAVEAEYRRLSGRV